MPSVAYAEHLLKLSYCNNVWIVREHHLVKLFQFCFLIFLTSFVRKSCTVCTAMYQATVERRTLSVTFSPFCPNVVFVIPAPISAALPCSRRHKLHIVCFRVNTKARSFRCSSSSKKSADFSGTPVIAKSYPIRTVIQLRKSNLVQFWFAILL